VETLHLTPDQQERLEAIFAKNRRAFIDLKADVERRQLDLEELLARKDSEPKKVSSAVDALEQARLRLRKAHAMMVIEQREILNAEQWQMFLDRAEEARQMRGEGRLQRRGGFRRNGRGGVPPQADEKRENRED
jgi:Spy/CpxP family protein refolding chaperone